MHIFLACCTVGWCLVCSCCDLSTKFYWRLPLYIASPIWYPPLHLSWDFVIHNSKRTNYSVTFQLLHRLRGRTGCLPGGAKLWGSCPETLAMKHHNLKLSDLAETRLADKPFFTQYYQSLLWVSAASKAVRVGHSCGSLKPSAVAVPQPQTGMSSAWGLAVEHSATINIFHHRVRHTTEWVTASIFLPMG
jgi:hypothetical protein